MNKIVCLMAILAASVSAPLAQAAVSSYDVVAVWREPQTDPNDTIFVGSFDYDDATYGVSNLRGRLSESMTGGSVGYPNDSMTWLDLNNQLASWHDDALGGTFAAAFRNTDTNTFWTGAGGDGWSPADGIAAGNTYFGFPRSGNNPGNAYALIFVPDDPTASLTSAQLAKLAYADCAPGGMMSAVCMSGTSVVGYGAAGSMDGFPFSQTIAAAAVPEPETWWMLLAGLGAVAVRVRRNA